MESEYSSFMAAVNTDRIIRVSCLYQLMMRFVYESRAEDFRKNKHTFIVEDKKFHKNTKINIVTVLTQK